MRYIPRYIRLGLPWIVALAAVCVAGPAFGQAVKVKAGQAVPFDGYLFSTPDAETLAEVVRDGTSAIQRLDVVERENGELRGAAADQAKAIKDLEIAGIRADEREKLREPTDKRIADVLDRSEKALVRSDKTIERLEARITKLEDRAEKKSFLDRLLAFFGFVTGVAVTAATHGLVP